MFSRLFGAAGFAELTPQEEGQFEQTLLLVSSIPFVAYCIGVIVFLFVLFRKPSRRRMPSVRLVAALTVFFGSLGLLLLIPTLPFWSALLLR